MQKKRILQTMKGTPIIEKTQTIKVQIIEKIIQSMFLAFCLSFGSMLLIFVWMEHFFQSFYENVMNWYNTDATAGVWIMLILLLQFILHTFWIFLKRMNQITNAITAISEGVHGISSGRLYTRIAEQSPNELGILAQDINQMAESIEQSVEKEKQWNQERYNMITNMSHDLKTPMMSIIGYTDRIQNKKYEDEQELNQYCGIVAAKTEELNTVVNQLFQLSKISSSEFKVNKMQIHLMEFAQQVLMSFIPQMEKENIEYSLEIAGDLQIQTDPDMMRHIFENIISNTIKYAAEGHDLRIAATQNVQGTCITFTNHGPQIPADEIDDIFHRFYREKKNTGKEGSGCGLYIVKQMTEMLGGSITVQSSQKETKFRLQFK